ncbi:Cullin binding-domain-containing protein [Dipodascopsis tothii]|uniref:Cullin binding-domain-containing protein n=1 Tax=Dipodascopsis tothii TaxID=44089 RepID=UPI0034CD3D11
MVAQLSRVVPLTQARAATLLRQNGWRVDAAVEAHYAAEDGARKRTNTKAIEAVFDKYAALGEAEPGEIGIDGTIALVQDLGLDLEEPAVLAVACVLGAPSMGVFTRTGFVDGWAAEGADSAAAMASKAGEYRRRLAEDAEFFARVYRFTFAFVRAPGQRAVQLDTAIDYWRLLLADKFPEGMQARWETFLTAEYKRSIPKDTWNMLLDFTAAARADPALATYDAEAAWPSIFDDFVAYLRS